MKYICLIYKQFVGQRLSEDDRCEFLIQWRSEFGKR